MTIKCNILFTSIYILIITYPCLAADKLIISRSEHREGIANLAGERILEKAYAELNIDFELQGFPSKRSLFLSNKGETDGEFLRIAGIQKEFPNLIMIPVPIGYVDIVVYTKDVEFTVDGWESLKPYSIGMVRGFKLIRYKTTDMHVEEVTTIEQAFRKLNLGRNDVVVDSRSSEYKPKEMNLPGIYILEPPVDRLVLYHYLHARHRSLAIKLETILKRMEKEGKLKKIRDQAVLDYRKLSGQ